MASFVVAAEDQKEVPRSRGLRPGKRFQTAAQSGMRPAGTLHAWQTSEADTPCQTPIDWLYSFPEIPFPPSRMALDQSPCEECQRRIAGDLESV